MPQVTNTFIRSKMNKDLDSRLLPNGEYRDAKNLQLSRSEGSEVGEFENIPGNIQLTGLKTGLGAKVIGQFTDETNNILYVYSAGYTGEDRCPRDIQVFSEPAALNPVTGTVIELYNSAGQLLNADNLGLEVGMTLWSDNAGWNGVPSTQQPFIGPTITQITGGINPSITVNVPLTFSAGSATGDTINIGWANMIHRYDITNDILTLLVIGSFLNFSQSNPIFATNLLDDLLFWTDNRNQPRKINVSSANPLGDPIPSYYVNEDQISVAKYYPYETPIVLEQVIRVADSGAQATAPGAHARGYDLTMLAGSDLSLIKIGDIVSGFPGQELQELWNVIDIDETNEIITIYNNFKDGDSTANMQPGTWDEATDIELKFSRTAMTNSEARLFDRGFDTNAIGAAGAVIIQGNTLEISYQGFQNLPDDPSPLPTPRVGDYIVSNGPTAQVTGTPVVANNIVLQDEVIIESIQSISALPPLASNSILLTLNKEIEFITLNPKLSISPNPNYSLGQIPPTDFTGDPDLIEEKFVRFSYRFKFDDDEYSLAAPYTQICFIPDHDGYFGGGKNDSLQDQVNTYDSSIVDWFTNQIDTVALKIPLPDTANNAADIVDNLINSYKVASIEILYKESDALSSKILEVIDVDNTLANFVEEIPETTNLFSSPVKQWYYNFDYKSIKPYRTLPTSEQNRVYDNVPIKALGQEITANRVMYGNFLQKHTPPNGIDFEILQSDKSVLFNNYAQYPNHSLKQNRNYQAGFVLADRYGRASSVVLSTNDDNPDKNGSTIYVPYKDWPDVGGPEANITTGITPNTDRIYSWLGTALRIKINNGITQIQNNNNTGEPGLYKSESDTSVDAIASISGGGVGHVVGDIIRYGYQVGNLGLGVGLETEVVSETGGVITGLKIISRGTGYVDGQQLFQTFSSGAGTGAVIVVSVFDANPTGWQSYKIVVKQQEQEYYNVYLGGYTSGYPVREATDFGRVAFATLIGDNINKVPRDLQEVGPLQTEFSASVKLFGRVNNPSINNNNKPGGPFYFDNRQFAWNTQYFPGRINDEVVTVGSVGQGGLELANSPFSDGNTSAGAFVNPTGPTSNDGKVPWGRPGLFQNFIGVEQNPAAMGLKVGVESPQPNLTREGAPMLNTLGAKVTNDPVGPAMGNTIGCMYPYLAVSETEPVESQLEIFYESSTSGNFVDLNRLVVSDYGGVSTTTVTTGNFDEDEPSGSTIITGFSFTDSSGNELTLNGDPADPTDIGVVITQVLDQWGNDVTGIFSIVPTVAFSYDDFNIETTTDFAYLKSIDPTHANQWTISFQTEYDDGSEIFVDNLTNQITIDLNNIAPSIGGFTPTQTSDADNGVEQACSKAGGTPGYDTTMTGVVGQFTNVVNGSVDATRDTAELCYSLAVLSEPVGSTATWSIDQSGNVSITAGTVNGSYEIECTVTDASPACNPDPDSLTDTCVYELVFGTPPVDQALCFGPTVQMSNLDTTCTNNTGEPLEVFFGASRFVNSGIVGNAGAIIGSDTNEATVVIDAGLGALGPSYGISSNNGQDLAYYNVLNEARYAANRHECFEPNPTPPPAILISTPNFTTGALTQGILAIEVSLSKTATVGTQHTYATEYTILYRPTPADTWQIATADASSPTNPGATVGGFNNLTVNVSGASTATATYYFSATGEYAVRTNGVHNGNGCNVSACFTCARTDVNFYDALYGPVGAPCSDCDGPL